MMDIKKAVLGIELGSTRIKAVLIDEDHIPVASGDYEWENQLVNGVWTYPMEAVHTGLQTCFSNLKNDVRNKFGVELTTVGAIGVSAMMIEPQAGPMQQALLPIFYANKITGFDCILMFCDRAIESAQIMRLLV